MSVKEILQSLVDDDMVDSERIGTSNYFWAFPSKAMNKVSQSLKSLKVTIIAHFSSQNINLNLFLRKKIGLKN